MDAGEVATLLGFLEFQRATLAWKCAGLDADALQMALKPSSMTLGGMITHLAWVEDYWFTCVLLDRPTPPLWEEVDWDAWLGPCPWRPYNSAYVKGGWRGHYDFHTSCIGEWGAHTFAQSQAGIDALNTSAVRYQYVKNPTGDGMVTKFANGVQMILQREGWHGSCGMKFEGNEGWVTIADGYEKPEASSPGLIAEGEKLVAEYSERTGRPMNHVRNFFDCVKSRKPTVANAEVMHRSMSTVHAANICMWLKRDMFYDPVREEFLNDAEANRLRTRAQREPWII